MLKLPDKSENQTFGLRFTVRRSRLFLSRPILRTPVLEIPFGAVVVAFVIDVIKPVDGQDEIGRIIIDIQMNGIQAGAHGLQLPEAEAGEPVFRDQLRCRGAGDVFLKNALIFRVDVQQARHGDPGGQEPLIITLLGGKLVPELIILAWLVVDLFDDVFAALVRGQIGALCRLL